MKTLRDINVLIVIEDDNKKFSERIDEKNIADNNRKLKPFSSPLLNKACTCDGKEKKLFF